jgi:peptidoglycan LD-endopeptidase CwlK
MFKFSESSESRFVGVDGRLVNVARRALEISKVDFGIPPDGGLRTAERQNELFKKKASKADGYENKSYHQSGKALDVYAYVDGKASWYSPHLAMLACAMLQAASELGVKLEWGGLWSTSDTIEGVEYGWDAGHFQITED